MLELLTTKRIETYFGRSQRSVALGDLRSQNCGVSLIFMTKYMHYSLSAFLMNPYHSFTKYVCLDMLRDLLSLPVSTTLPVALQKKEP